MNLERLTQSYKIRKRDFIFLVNQSQSMAPYEHQAAEILKIIMDPKNKAIFD